MNIKRALVCAPLLPEYDRESGSRRIFHLVEFLREAGWAVSFVAQNAGAGERYVRALQQRGVATYSGFDSGTDEVVASGRFDLAIFAFWYLAELYLPAVRTISPTTRVIVDSIDLHFLRFARQTLQEPVLHQLDPESKSEARLMANPNPVPAGFGLGATTISWATDDGSEGQVYISEDGGEERLFAEGSTGSEEAPWIAQDKTYKFYLYSGTEHKTLLDTVTVTVGPRINGLDSDYANQMIREVNTYAAADAVMTVSQKEANLVNDLVGDPTLAYAVPDCEDLTPSTLPFARRKGIVFIGNFRHPPNIEALEYLCKDVLPLLDPALMAEHPVYIVGNGLDDKLRNYGRGLPHVHMIGWVPSVLPYLMRARISVIPLLHGAGTKRKLVQALMVGTPTVSTSVGTEGLNLQDGEHVLVANDPEVFASSVTRLLTDAKLWRGLSRQGRTHIMPVHGREATRARLMEVVSAALSKVPKLAESVEPSVQLNGYRLKHHQYRRLIRRVQEVVGTTVPSGATVVVVSKGDNALLRLDDRRAWHFPQVENGTYAGYYPASSAEAIKQLEELREKGRDFLLFPSTALWWFGHYPEFKQHLESRYREVVHDEDACLIYSLGDPETDDPDVVTQEGKDLRLAVRQDASA